MCVRYRYDDEARRRFRAVELVVEEVPWEQRPRFDPLVRIRVRSEELEIRARVKQAGGKWLPNERVWELRRSEVRRLRLTGRITSKPLPPNQQG